jgi:hypothetical protein
MCDAKPDGVISQGISQEYLDARNLRHLCALDCRIGQRAEVRALACFILEELSAALDLHGQRVVSVIDEDFVGWLTSEHNQSPLYLLCFCNLSNKIVCKCDISAAPGTLMAQRAFLFAYCQRRVRRLS